MTKTRTVTYNPISVMEGANGLRFSLVACAIILAAFTMLGFGSKGLLGWANDLPINKVTDYILYIAQTWQDLMDKTGITAFSDKIHDVLLALQALRW